MYLVCVRPWVQSPTTHTTHTHMHTGTSGSKLSVLIFVDVSWVNNIHMVLNKPRNPGHLPLTLPTLVPDTCPLIQTVKSLWERPTFTLRYVCGAIKVSRGISWAGNTVIFSKFGLVCPSWATNTSVSGGVVEMSR